MIAYSRCVANRLVLAGIMGAAMLSALLLGDSASAAPPCNTNYTQDFFHVCFFEGTSPATGAYLGSENEPGVGQPAPDRAYGINREWGAGPIFAGRSDDISGVWRGSISLSGGRFLFSVFPADEDRTPLPGEEVRLYVDEALVLDQWTSSDNEPDAVPLDLGTGYHNIRVEWFETTRPPPDPQNPDKARLVLHWDKVQMPEILTNGSFESGTGTPTGWQTGAWNLPAATFTWDSKTFFVGSRSVKIRAQSTNDAYWTQPVAVQPNTDYILSGWIKTQNVAGGAGANLGLYGTFTYTAGVFDTTDWTYITLPFNSGTASQVTVAARLGYWAYTSTGSAWFDSVRLERVSPVIVDAFVLKSQHICIAGTEYTSGTPFVIYHPVNPPQQWQWTGAEPVVLKESDPAISNYSKVECYQFGFTDPQVSYLDAELNKWASNVTNWSFGTFKPTIELTEISGEITLTRDGDGLRLYDENIAAETKPNITSDTDFVFAFTSAQDPRSEGENSGSYYLPPVCGNNFGPGRALGGLWGSTLVWIPHSCVSDRVITYEWNHTMDDVMYDVMGIQDPVRPPGPSCDAEVDSYRMYPNSHQFWQDPDSPWCGLNATYPNVVRPATAYNLTSHFDHTLAHYLTDHFTGNHCNNGRPDTNFGETGVDTGAGYCPGEPPEVVTRPSNGSLVSGTYPVVIGSYDAAYVEISIDGQLVKTDAFSPYDYSWDTTGYAECSSHTVSARAVDWGGLSATASATVKVSNTNLDSDGDGFRDCYEEYMGTNVNVACPADIVENNETVDAWPPDFDDDTFVDNSDVGAITSRFGAVRGGANYSARYDLDPDGAINTSDLSAVSSRFGQTCMQLDSDGDGFFDGYELYMGTDPIWECAATSTPDDEPVDSWPPDFNDDTFVNTADWDAFVTHFPSQRGDATYDPRYDLNADDSINVTDRAQVILRMGQSCTRHDTDGDGFLDGAERYMGTNVNVACPATSTANDEPVDAWPPDFDDNKVVDSADASAVSSRSGADIGETNYDPRFDLNADGHINIVDVATVSSWAGSCG
jgi:Bacterial Ig domain/Bacterial TSP3 repeat